MFTPMSMPQFQGGGNSLIDFSPIQRGLADYRQGEAEVYKANMGRKISNALASGDYAGAQAASDDPSLAVNIAGLKQRTELQDAQLRHQRVQAVGGIAQMIDKEADPGKRTAMWQRLMASDPRLGQLLPQDSRDAMSGPKYLVAEAAGYRDPLHEQLQRSQLATADVQRQTASLDMQIKRRELDSPASKLTTVPEGGTLVMTDPRSGTHSVVAQGGPKIDATTKKAIDEADDFVAQTHTAIGALNEAMRLNGQAYSGIGASQRASAANNLVPWSTPDAAATTNLENVVTNQALQSLRATFGGNPTEGERKILMGVSGSVNQPANVRAEIYGRAMEMARQRLAINRQKAASLRSGGYYKEGGQPGAVDRSVSLAPHGVAPSAAQPAAQPKSPVPVVSTPEEAAKLPPGTQFITPDGQIRERH